VQLVGVAIVKLLYLMVQFKVSHYKTRLEKIVNVVMELMYFMVTNLMIFLQLQDSIISSENKYKYVGYPLIGVVSLILGVGLLQ
jgi:hypothetical protein